MIGSCHGGGVAILCRSDWKVNILALQNQFECLWCKIQTKKTSKFYVGAIYYPPEPEYLESEFLYHISANCEQILLIDPNAKLIIAADINQLKMRDFTATSLT